MSTLTEDQREEQRAAQAHQMHKWSEQRVWDLCDDIAGRGCTSLDKLSDAEIAAYARGVRNTLEAIRERFECADLRLQTLIDGSMGERYHRADVATGRPPSAVLLRRTGRSHGFKRRQFGNLALEIRAHRVAMLDEFVTFDYPRWSGWKKRVWAIERKGVEREDWEEFERLQHELNALWSLSNWLSCSEHWREKNWAWRKAQELKVAA